MTNNDIVCAVQQAIYRKKGTFLKLLTLVLFSCGSLSHASINVLIGRWIYTSFNETCGKPASRLNWDTKPAASKECPPRSSKKSIDGSMVLFGNVLRSTDIILSCAGAFRSSASCASLFGSMVKDSGIGKAFRLIF